MRDFVMGAHQNSNGTKGVVKRVLMIMWFLQTPSVLNLNWLWIKSAPPTPKSRL